MIPDEKYIERLRHTREPYVGKKFTNVSMDLHGLSQYAKQQGKKLYEMSEDEVEKFIPTQEPLPMTDYLIEEYYRELAEANELKSPGLIDVSLKGYTNVAIPSPDLYPYLFGKYSVETEGVRVVRRSLLYKYNIHTGWGADWEEYLIGSEVLAVVLWGTTDIQGLVALKKDKKTETVKVNEMHVAPWNKPTEIDSDNIKYHGIGVKLFHLATEWGVKHAPGWPLVGNAATSELARYYCKMLGANLVGDANSTGFKLDTKRINQLRAGIDCELTAARL